MSWFASRLGRWIAPYRWTAAAMLGALLADLAYESLLPLAFKVLIDDAISPRDARVLTLVGAGLVGLALLSALAAVTRDWLYARLSAQVLRDLRVTLFGHLQRLSLAWYSRTPAGEVLARFSTDLAAVENALVLALPAGVYSALGVVAAAGILFWLEWRMALLACVGIPLCLLGPKLIGPRAQALGLAMKEGQAALGSTVQENVAAQPVIKAFGLETRLAERFAAQAGDFLSLSRRANFLSYLMERTPNLGLMAFNVMVVVAGAWLAFEGHLAIGALVAFQGLFVNLSQSVYGLTWVLPHFVQAQAGLQRIEALLDEVPEIADAPDAVPLPRLAREIEFRAVDFAYAGGGAGLRGVSLRIPRGAYVAFVGASGSGKSTVLALLLRFHDPASGAVLLDGVDLRRAAQRSLREQSGVVMQESFLFNASVADNLRLVKPDASPAQIEAACRAAEVHTVVAALPQGYDTVVGERGGRLSGGQRQRLAIARALLRDPELLLLDEATSALDPATEAALNDTLTRVARGRTVVAVTHRLAQVVHADRIFVMDGGRLVEQGSHRELLAAQGAYRAMWDKQSGFSVAPGGDWTHIDAARLARLPVLEALDRESLEEVAQAFVTEHYPAGRMVIHEGDPGDRFYIIVRGSVQVLRSGGEEAVAVLEDGDHFGEIALLRDVPRTASVRTLTPCTLVALPRGQFQQLLGRSEYLRERLEESLAGRVR